MPNMWLFLALTYGLIAHL